MPKKFTNPETQQVPYNPTPREKAYWALHDAIGHMMVDLGMTEYQVLDTVKRIFDGQVSTSTNKRKSTIARKKYIEQYGEK